jgi:YfiH family protein
MIKIKWKQETEPCLQVHEKQGVTYLTYPQLDRLPGFLHGFSTRVGGVSEGCLSSMNLSFSRGDTRENVMENYRRIASAIGFSLENVVTSDQTHTTNVQVVGEADRGNGITKARPYHDVDGLITNVPGLVLTTYYADCVPLYFIDPVKRAIGLSHSGWRGTVQKMGAVTLQRMRETYGCDPADLYAAIGPSICQDCYEVSEDVIEAFRENYKEQYWPGLFYKKENGRYQLNLWEANRIVLMEAGIRPERISLPNLCTCCNPEFLFSHRASKGKRGNLAAFLAIQP